MQVMTSGQFPVLRMPSFLYGSYAEVQCQAQQEGLRCGARYREDSTFPAPLGMRDVLPGEVVVAQGVVDFQRERPAWRLYMVSELKEGLWEALDYPGSYEVDDRYEDFCRQSAWGALYVALARAAPMSAERVARRLQSVLDFWEVLQSARYLWSTPSDAMTLEELMGDSHGWAMDAWCPVGDGSVRARLGTVVERMTRATREDCLAAILRQMPRALNAARRLQHRGIVAAPDFQRQRLVALDAVAFERLSGAFTSELIRLLNIWDRQLGKQ